jgi:hypothetical protein
MGETQLQQIRLTQAKNKRANPQTAVPHYRHGKIQTGALVGLGGDLCSGLPARHVSERLFENVRALPYTSIVSSKLSTRATQTIIYKIYYRRVLAVV